MLELIILPPNAASTDDAVFWLEVANVGGGRLAKYQAWAIPLSLADPVELRDYPRWSEPAGALCTRLLSLALKRVPLVPQGLMLPQFSILIQLTSHGRGEPKLLERFEVSRTPIGWHMRSEHGEWSISAGTSKHPVKVSLRLMTQAYWGSARIRKAQPLAPPVYSDGKTPYVRISDLPEPVKSIFAVNISRSSRPHPPGVRDAVFLWDWEDFLDGGR